MPSSGSDQDTFFQIKATTTGGYAGLGVGSQMAGSLIFVVYKNSAGDNITLSPRLGKYVRLWSHAQNTADIRKGRN